MVGVVDDGGEVIACRSGDDDLLCAGLDVCGSLCLGGVETCALENNVYLQLAPGEFCRVGFCIDGDFLTVNDDGTGSDNGLSVFCEDCVLIIYRVLAFTELAGETALGGVILEKMGEHFRTGEVIDGDYFVTVSLKHLTERQTADTAKTVDCNSIHMNFNKC